MQSNPNVTVRFTAVLQKHVNGNKEIKVQGGNISELLDDLEEQFPGFLRQLMRKNSSTQCVMQSRRIER